MSEPMDIPSKEMEILAQERAALCAFLAAHFLNLPDESFVRQLRAPDLIQLLEHMQADENSHQDLIKGVRLMHGYLVGTLSREADELAEDLGVDRTRLYRGVSPTYGPPPPYETVWSANQESATARLHEIAGIYHESGLTQSSEVKERVDYIGVELAFIEQLAQAEARAWASGDQGQAQDLLDRQRAFLRDHLAPWVAQFVKQALEYASTDFYRGHLFILRGFVEEQSEVLTEFNAFGHRAG